ncbi:hypothetical protein [Desulfosporosinus sp.]|uniref:hypothetical protein n=1 Tax=Desulfosporosinus sp. TaxID=157907 RepID=UPI002632EC29|nr:hypothetical protein [Desulfosporosinus sp.]
MSEPEMQAVKDDIAEIKGDVKELMKIVNSNQFDLLENYVKKSEFNEYKKDEVINRRWWAGYIIAGMTFLITLWKLVQPLLVQAKVQ